MEELDLGFPRDDDRRLFLAIVESLGEETWCEYDVAALDLDVALRHSWIDFCKTVKFKRRFFFHSTGEDGIDSWTPLSLLTLIADHSEQIGLIRDIAPGKSLWRARPDLPKHSRTHAADYGPPPVEYALQSNRMNPPGIPLLYAASSIETALRETRATTARLGMWRVDTPLRILDLRTLPPVPGMFSDATRTDRHTLCFLHAFANDIMQPVERSNRVNVDYLPSQVMTEFMRDYPFRQGAIDGVAYPSTVHPAGWNVALFLSLAELGLSEHRFGQRPPVRLSFRGSRWAERLPDAPAPIDSDPFF